MSSFIAAISALNNSGVKFVVVGGFASVMHGNNRFTSDIDVVVDLEPAESKKAVDSLLAAGLQPSLKVDPRLFSDPKARNELKESKQLRFFGFFDPNNPTFGVDLFLEYPMDFASLYKNSVVLGLRGEKCRICSLDDLIAMKQKAGRPQDQLDLQVLAKLKETGKGAK